MKVQLLQEPELQFGAGRHVDTRFGLANYGPLDFQSSVAPKHIRVGIVGTAQSVEGVRDWLNKCRGEISAKDSNKPNLFPAFPGFTIDRLCHAELVLDVALERTIPMTEIARLCKLTNEDVVIVEAANLFLAEFRLLAERNATDVLVCAVPFELINAMDPGSGGGTEEVADTGQPEPRRKSSSLDFHDLLKAKAMSIGQPVQLIVPATYDPSKRRQQKGRSDRLRVLQDEATRAWNFHVALYYKAGGLPWRLIREPTDLETCYVGISFFRSLDKATVSTSIAQVFNERGVGVVVRGGSVIISKKDRNPHLSESAAFTLLDQALDRYRQEHRHSPARVVIHKTSTYDRSETDGFVQAVQSRNVDSFDLLNIQKSFRRLFRDGRYPPLRGTFFSLDEKNHILYTRGSVEFFATYAGLYVPKTLFMDCVQTCQTPKFLAHETLALTKMNWNNTQFDGGSPITVRASRQVGHILKYLGETDPIQNRYSFYM